MLSFWGKVFYKISSFVRLCKEAYLTSVVNAKGTGRICGDVIVQNGKNIFIGNNSFVNGGQLIAGENSKIVIGNDCMISYNVHLRTTYHNYKDRSLPMNKQGMEEADIIIKDNVWIGYGVQVMSGVTINEGSVVAAGAVVTKDVPPNCCVAGIPAKVIFKIN